MRRLCISVISDWLMAVGPACVHRARSSMCLLPPMDSSVSGMEPEDTPQLTPPALLALSTASSRVRNVTAGRPCSRSVGGRRATSEVQRALTCTSPVSRKEWLHTMQDEGHPAFESDMWISAAQIALHLPTQLSLWSCLRLLYATIKSNTSQRTWLL